MTAQFLSYLPTLRINDEEVKLSSFRLDAPAQSLGVRADCVIADPAATIARGDQFDLTLRLNTGSLPKRRLIKNGTVVGTSKRTASSRSQGFSVPSDSLSIVGVDSVTSRFNLAPRVPMILYDPIVVVLQDNETDSNINDENGDRIISDTRAVDDLDLYQILDFAYVESCGFDEVITNIPTYFIPRADFSLSASFHSIASSFYSLFEPVVSEDDNVLTILDIFGEIPEEILAGAKTVGVNKYFSLDTIEPELNITNAILLSHKEISVQSINEDEFPVNVTQRVDEDPPSVSGNILDSDYRSTIFRRFIAEIHDDEDNPARITSEITWKTETETTGKDEEGTNRVLSKEIQIDRYSNSWRLKLGYTKTVEAYTEDGISAKILQNVYTETNTLSWRPLVGKPGEWEKLRSETKVEGLVLVEGGDEEEGAIKTPWLEASRNRLIVNDGSDDVQRMPISSKIEIWRPTGADQIEVHIEELDLLTGRLKKSGTTQHVGTNNVRVRTGETFNTRQVLIVDEDSDEADGPRVPASFDAGYVEYAIARELALRRLALLRTPRALVKAELTSFDPGIGRGSIRTLVDREGGERTAIIIGYQVEAMPVKMTIDAVVIA
jgi:hypothetical protein